MKKETKELIVKMVKTWNQFNCSKTVDVEIEEDEFSKGHWSLSLRIRGVVNSDFVMFLLPSLVCQECHWFIHECGGRVVFNIQ